MYENQCTTNVPVKTPLVNQSLGNINSLITDLEKVISELFQRLIPIRKQTVCEAKKEELIPKSGVQLVDELDSQGKRILSLNKKIIELLGELEV